MDDYTIGVLTNVGLFSFLALSAYLLLVVGEMDTNVPPESTMRFVDALIKAGKDFDLLVVPEVDLFVWRNLAALIAMVLLLYGLIWKTD